MDARGLASTPERIVELLYEGTLDDQAWSKAIRSLTCLVGGASAILFGVDPRSRTTFRAEPHAFDQKVLDDFCAHWFDQEVRLPPALAVPLDEPIVDARLMPVRVWKRTPIFNDFLRPIDRPWFLCFWLHKTAEKLSILAIHGTRKRGPFDARDGALLQPLIPHLRRAITIRDHVSSLRARTEAMEQALQRLPFGAIVLDERGRVVEASATASALMVAGSGLRCAQDGSVRIHGPSGARLDRWIRRGPILSGGGDALLRTHGPNGTTLSVLVAPLARPTPSWAERDPCWLLMVFKSDTRRLVRASLLAESMGLTEREAELAARLAEGVELKAVAGSMAISIHTARTHLKAVFRKTGCSSQADLVRAVISGPAGWSCA
ncbi:MAG: helix-turn-helix transcriptional regulator [Steroidobacteraceae bacterium]|jgi:DNA-binding CsgD family transcriptional regulator|nr:helix-turn-helix transcriptional regulator [Steroidobacteraceae bacterium]